MIMNFYQLLKERNKKKYFVLGIVTVVLLNIGLGDMTPVWAETVNLSTYYPAPFGSYDRLRLVPRDALEDECNVGTMYTDKETKLLQFCAESKDRTQWRPVSPITVERGNLTIIDKGDYSVTFEKAFTSIPLIQVYLIVKDEEAPGGKNVMMGNFFPVTKITPKGFVINHQVTSELLTVHWVAIGD